MSSPPLLGLQMETNRIKVLINPAQGSNGVGGRQGVHGGGERPVPSLFHDAPDLDLPGSGAKLKQLASH